MQLKHRHLALALIMAGLAIVAPTSGFQTSPPPALGQVAAPAPAPPAGAVFSGACAFANGILDVQPGAGCSVTFLALQGPGTYSASVSGPAVIGCPTAATNCSTGSNTAVSLLGSAADQALSLTLTLSSSVVPQARGVSKDAGPVTDAGDSQTIQATLALSGPKGSIATVSIDAGVGVVYAAGWNLVGVPTGTMLSAAATPLYTLRATDTAYVPVSSNQPLLGGEGYWALFYAATTVILPDAGPQSATVYLPAGHYVQVGNPGSKPVALTGADMVLGYNPSSGGFVQTTILEPGQGAWAISRNGATLTLTPTDLPSPATASR
jgi:hypothetical protein